jgi:hypothetical protein
MAEKHFPISQHVLPRSVERALVHATWTLTLVGLAGCQTDQDRGERLALRIEEPVTHIVSPVDPHGYVDYLEAANLRHATGVTPENNWEVAVRRVFGPLDWDEGSRREYYRRLGIPEPNGSPDTADVLRPLGADPAGDSAVNKQLLQQSVEIEKPWTAGDYPEYAQWLQEQSRHLDYLVENSRRARHYVPYVLSAEGHAKKILAVQEMFSRAGKSGEPAERLAARVAAGLFGAHRHEPAPLSRFHAADSGQQSREVARLLRTRMLRRIAENDLAGARADLLALHRIGRLLSEGLNEEWLVGLAVDRMASFADAALLESGKLTKDDCRQHLADLTALPPLRSIADMIDIDNRHQALDAMQFTARRWPEACTQLDALPEKPSRKIRRAIRELDWNEALRRLNTTYDAYVAALREPDVVQRAARAEATRPGETAHDFKAFLECLFQAASEGPQELAQFMARQYFDRTAWATASDLELDYQMWRAVVRVACAAYLCRLEKPGRRVSAAALTPWLEELPTDAFTGLPLRWKPLDGGVVIYSVGVNRIDDDGVSLEDGIPRKDDIRVRLTGP